MVRAPLGLCDRLAVDVDQHPGRGLGAEQAGGIRPAAPLAATSSSDPAASSMARASAAGSVPVIQPAASPTTSVSPPPRGDHRPAVRQRLGRHPPERLVPHRRHHHRPRCGEVVGHPGGRHVPAHRMRGPAPAAARATWSAIGPSPTMQRLACGCRTAARRRAAGRRPCTRRACRRREPAGLRARSWTCRRAGDAVVLQVHPVRVEPATSTSQVRTAPLMATDVIEVRASRRKMDVAPVTKALAPPTPGSSGGGCRAAAIPGGTGGSGTGGSRCPRRTPAHVPGRPHHGHVP